MDDLHDVVCLENSVHDGNVLSGDLVDRDVANFVPRVWRIDKEKEVPAVKCGLHRAAIWLEQSHLARGGGSPREEMTHLRTTTIGDSVFVTSPRPL